MVYPDYHSRRGQSLKIEDSHSGINRRVRALSIIIKAITISGIRLPKLYVNSINYMFFDSEFPGEHVSGLKELTSLKVEVNQVGVRRPHGDLEPNGHECSGILQKGALIYLLDAARKLTSLHVGLDSPGWRFTDAAATIGAVIPLAIPFPCLEKLSLACIRGSEQEFTQLLCSHARTLRKLRLTASLLEPAGNLANIFETARSKLRLEEARFKGLFQNYNLANGREKGPTWDMGAETGRLLEGYMLKGGECLLTDDYGEFYRMKGHSHL
ncbi:hypothetical protein BS50DRAFT_585167 [Corynespora cassiicola Philippines]|uniref:RNI-like protein n=1 Tax=Corynespora cassiicola Philippines TaxID=1448308 RepID=A0A2T2NW87_CORCC|nr:hypothetical protein BS50DRAFT_585167 [Corynespora cassiicola Philippines]